MKCLRFDPRHPSTAPSCIRYAFKRNVLYTRRHPGSPPSQCNPSSIPPLPLVPSQDEETSVPDPPSEPSSFTRKITTEYLRLGNEFLGRTSGEIEASTAAAAAANLGEGDEGGDRHGRIRQSSVSTLAFAEVDRRERHRRVFSEEVVGTGWGGETERRHRASGAVKSSLRSRGSAVQGVGDKGEEEEKGIEMQETSLQISDGAGKAPSSVGGGSMKGESARIGVNEGEPSFGFSGPARLSQRLSRDGSSSSPPLPSLRGHSFRENRSAESMASSVSSEEGGRRASASSSLAGGNRSTGTLDRVGTRDIVSSPQNYTLKGRGGGGETSDEEDQRLPVILPRDDVWVRGHSVVGRVLSGTEDNSSVRSRGKRKDEGLREGEADDNRARSPNVSGDDGLLDSDER